MGLYSNSSRGSSQPYVRWWWLSGPFTESDIDRQLAWIAKNGFGGVELAWLLPAWLEEVAGDPEPPDWLGARWSELAAFTKRRATELGLGCDFTFGSVWPFGGSWLAAADRAQHFFGPARQRIRNTWEQTRHGAVPVLNHLSGAALRRYAAPLLEALRPALAIGPPSALFCDSLELETGALWSPELWPVFEKRFGYDLRPLARALDSHPDVRYDYRKFLSGVLCKEFYAEFADVCRESGALSRVQCHGAPSDLLAAYAAVDVPESEALLFPPAFSRIAASAAAWTGKPLVSAEAFTCIYGFPGREAAAEELWKQEDIGDLKLLADALFANGVNRVVWHGMPYQPAGREVEFYASVHVGPDSPFAAALPEFNRYLARISSLLQTGESHAQIGVYLPWEDALMANELPPDRQTPGARHVWEMRYAAIPAELAGFSPVWISKPFLENAVCRAGLIHSRHLSLEALYLDCEWLDWDALQHLARLSDEGAAIVWKRRSREPGVRKHKQYQALAGDLARRAARAIENYSLTPLLGGDGIPPYWARRSGNELLLFFAHPLAAEICYPMPYRFSAQAGETTRELTLRWLGKEYVVRLNFQPGESIVWRVDASGANQLTK